MFAIAVGSALPVLSGTRATGIVVLALGVAASASAVVPSVDQLIHGNKLYLAVTALIGVVAICGGARSARSCERDRPCGATAAMVVLWLIATIHHSRLG